MILNTIKKLYLNSTVFPIFTIPFKIIDLFLIRKKSNICFYGYNGRYNGNAKALYEYYLNNESNLNPVWLLDKRDKHLFIDNPESFYIIPDKDSGVWDHLRFFYFLLTTKVLVLTRIGDIHIYRALLLKFKYIEVFLPHGITAKSGGVLSKHLSSKEKKIWEEIPKRFDMISVSSRAEQYWTAASIKFNPNKVKIIGPQRRDSLNLNLELSEKFKLKKRIISKTKISLDQDQLKKVTFCIYAPTHRDHVKTNKNISLLENLKEFDIQDLDNFLKDNNIILFLREHFEAKNTIESKESVLSNIQYLSQSKVPDLEEVILGMDVLITDYSGIYFELLESDISIAFVPYDLEDYEINRGLILPASVLLTGHKIKSQSDFKNYLSNRVSIDRKFISERKVLKALLFEVKKGDSCKLTKEAIDKMIYNT